MKAKRKFSSFDWKSAFIRAGIEQTTPWVIDYKPLAPTDFFKERLRRLEHFDLTSSERGKELIIDAVCEEALTRHEQIKIWKAAPLESEDLIGSVDYIAAPKRAYLETPLLCVVEAKKDDFEKGLAQCLVEMIACQWNNRQIGKDLAIYGVVTNGYGWQFYQLAPQSVLFESEFLSLTQIETVLGVLDYVFARCVEALS